MTLKQPWVDRFVLCQCAAQCFEIVADLSFHVSWLLLRPGLRRLDPAELLALLGRALDVLGVAPLSVPQDDVRFCKNRHALVACVRLLPALQTCLLGQEDELCHVFQPSSV